MTGLIPSGLKPSWLRVVTLCSTARGGSRAGRSRVCRCGSTPAGSGHQALHYSSHTGIYRTDRLRDAVVSPAYRVGYDSLLSAVLRMLGPVEVVDEPLYHRRLHAASLSHAPGTKIGSPERRRVRAELDVAYRKAYRMRSNPRRIRQIIAGLTPTHLWDEVTHHAQKASR